MSIKLTVLGCSGSEAKGVYPCSFLLGNELLFDAGSAASLLSVQAQTELRAIYLTHCHLDHIKDLAFIGENVFSLLKQPIQLFGPKAVLAALKAHFFNEIIWPDFTALPSVQWPVFMPRPLNEGEVPFPEGLPAAWRDITIRAVAVHHPGPTFGYLISGKRKTVVYTGDTGPTEKIWQMVNNDPKVQDIFLEATFPNRLADLAVQSQHLTPQGLKKELAKLQRKDIKIHVYHIKTPYHEEVEKEILALGDARLRLLNPGDSFEID